jgi:transposase
MWPSCWAKRLTASEKKITRQYKAQLTPAQRKEFRSLMWQFRRDPQDLKVREQAQLEQLFRRLPRLRTLYELRLRFKTIFDTLTQRHAAALALTRWCLDAIDAFPALEKFVCTYEKWHLQILNYFPEGATSATVEGINNKARVITKRAYGLKSADSLWTRLILDLNRAKTIAVHTITNLRQVVDSFRAIFSMACS